MSKPLTIDVGRFKVKLKYSDGVMMPSPFSRVLASSLRPGRCATALDMGCGCGFQAIVLAKLGVKRIFGIDIDKRCVAATEFNALLNDMSEWTGANPGIVALHGDMFSPLGDQKFDLIVSNPPTMPASDETPIYANGGKDGREFIDRLIECSASHLSDSGQLCFVQSSLADLNRTKELLQKYGFVFSTSKPHKKEFRPFYYPHLYFYQRRRLEGRAHFTESRNGRLFENLYVITATFHGRNTR